MFSKITIDESTTIPIPRINPAMVIILMVRSIIDMHIKVIKIEIGRDKPMINDDLIFLKKINIIITAKRAPVIPEEYTSPMVASIIVVSSLIIYRETPLGISSFI